MSIVFLWTEEKTDLKGKSKDAIDTLTEWKE